jgi:hypothetical protein
MIINATDLGTLVISQPSSELPPIRISLNVAVGGSLPAGGTVRQILRKSSSAPYDVEWSNDQDAQWGQVVGTITAQADLMALLAAKQSVSGMSNYLTLSQALAGYYPLNNPAGYVTASAIDDFLTTTEASVIYQTQANMAPYITDANAAIKLEPYCYPRYSNPSGFITSAALPDLTPYLTTSAAASLYQPIASMAGYATESWVTGRNYITAAALAGYATQSWVGSQGFITASALTGYATESWVTGRNYITAAALSGYAALSGATFGGKVNHTSVDGAAGVNIGIGGTATSATVAGDLWIATGGSNLNFRDATGAWRVVATQGQTNTFTTNQIISGSSVSSMLRVTQTGTGEALRIEDEANPDSTPFVVGADGRVGIHGTPATNTNHKLAIYNGNIVFSQGYGLAFGDGTTQVTAATPFDPAGYATELWVTNKDYATESFVTAQGYITQANLFGYAQLSGAAFVGSISTTNGRATFNPTDINTPAFNLGSQISSTPTNAVSGDMWITNATAAKLAYRVGANTYYPTVANAFNTFTGGIAITGTTASNPQLQVTQGGTAAAVIITSTGAGNALVVEDSTSPDATPFVINQFGKVGIGTAPDATAAIKIDGNGMSFNGLTVNPTSVTAHGQGASTNDLLITINGVNYAIPLRAI